MEENFLKKHLTIIFSFILVLLMALSFIPFENFYDFDNDKSSKKSEKDDNSSDYDYEEPEDIEFDTIEPGVLTVGVNPEYEPYAYIDEYGDIVGIEVDKIIAVADTLNISIKFVEMEFIELIGAVTTGRVDCVIGGVTHTTERDKVAHPSAVFSTDEFEGELIEYVIYSTKENDELATAIDSAIATLENDGTFDAIMSNYDSYTDYVTIPEIIGTPSSYAVYTLESLGLEVETHEMYDIDNEYSVVLTSTPAQGDVVPKGSVVRIYINKYMPDDSY